MTYFRILLHGKGIYIPAEDDPPITGFYTTRHVKAPSPKEACEKAKNMVLSDWRSGRYAQANQGNAPHLEIESTDKISFTDWLRSRNAGYTFYSPDESDEEAHQ